MPDKHSVVIAGSALPIGLGQAPGYQAAIKIGGVVVAFLSAPEKQGLTRGFVSPCLGVGKATAVAAERLQ
jgi:hypothetical protein